MTFFKFILCKILFFTPSDSPGECMHPKNISDMIGQLHGLDLDENSDWLHTNDSYVRGNPRHGGTASMPTVLSQDRAADGDSINVLTNADSQDVPEWCSSL